MAPLSERDALILKYKPLAEKLAGNKNRSTPYDVDLGQLTSAAYLGLVEAAGRYNPNLNHSFKHYAEKRISGAITDYLRGRDMLPRHVRNQLKEALTNIGDVEPCSLEGALIDSGYSPKEVDTLRRAYLAGQVLTDPDVISETVEALDPTAEDLCERNQTHSRLYFALDELHEREKIMLGLYYSDGMSMREIGKINNLSVSRVSQILTGARNKLKEKLEKILPNHAS